jgi:hypothetical protein
MKTITSIQRTSVNQLVLTLNDGTRRNLTAQELITENQAANLIGNSKKNGMRWACAGTGRITKLAA